MFSSLIVSRWSDQSVEMIDRFDLQVFVYVVFFFLFSR